MAATSKSGARPGSRRDRCHERKHSAGDERQAGMRRRKARATEAVGNPSKGKSQERCPGEINGARHPAVQIVKRVPKPGRRMGIVPVARFNSRRRVLHVLKGKKPCGRVFIGADEERRIAEYSEAG